MGVGLLLAVWVARFLGPQQFGLFSFASALVGLFGAVAGLGLQSIVVRDIACDPGCKEETLGTAAVLHLTGGVLAYCMILGAIFWLRPDDSLAKWLVAILGAMMLLKASDVAVYWFESQVLSKYAVWVQNSSFLVFAAVKVALILGNAPLLAFAWVTLAEAALVALLLLVMLGLRGPGLRKLKVTLSRAKVLLTDSWPLMLSGIAITIYMRIDLIMLGHMLGNEAVGVYSAATRISEVWYFVPSVVVASILPTLVHAKNLSTTMYKEHLQRLCKFLTWMAIVLAIPMTFMADWVVVLLYGPSYIVAGGVLSIHIWAAVFVFLGIGSGVYFTIENLAKKFFYRTAVGCVLNVLLNITLIPLYGIKGAAIATVFSQAFANYFMDAFDPKTRGLFIIKTKAFSPIKIFRK